MNPADDPNFPSSVVAAISAIVVAILGMAQIRRTIAQRRTKRTNDVPLDEREAAEQYVNDPGQFVAMVVKELRETKAELGVVKRELAGFKKAERTFRIALARWVAQILDDWGVKAEMPLPDEEDREILADVVPAALEATRPRIPKTKEENEDRRDPRPRRH